MRWWRKARAIRLLILVSMLTVLLLTFSFSALTATPSPGGATLALAALAALALPVSLGWAISRGDRELEQRAVRPIAWADLGLILTLVLGVAATEVVLYAAGITPPGLVAARAVLTYTGMMLAAASFTGWRSAAIVPVVYFTVVLVIGGGSDVENPAPWAWIGAPDASSVAMTAAVATFLIGVTMNARWALRQAASPV